MISQLVAVERKPIIALQDNKTTLSNEKTAWSDLNSVIQSLQTSVQNLSALDDFDAFTSSSTITGSSTSVSDLLSVAVGSDASEGSYDIKVTLLATAEKLKSSIAITSTSEARGISGTVDINGRTDPIEGPRGEPRLVQDLAQEGQGLADVIAGGQLGHHASVFGMDPDLAVDGVGDQARPGVVDGDAGLVAGGFDAEDAHGAGVVMVSIQEGGSGRRFCNSHAHRYNARSIFAVAGRATSLGR